MSVSDTMESNGAIPSDGAYPVGYRKPPAQNRFRPGQSGNPKGRPTGAKGVRGLVNSALDETVRVAENGRARSIRKRQAILLAMIAKAIKGDVRAAALVMRLMETHDPSPHHPEEHLSHEDWLKLLSDEELDDNIARLSVLVDGDGIDTSPAHDATDGGR